MTKVISDKCSVKKSINTLTSCGSSLHENICVGVSEYCEIFQSTYFEENLQAAASENVLIKIIHKEN